MPASKATSSKESHVILEEGGWEGTYIFSLLFYFLFVYVPWYLAMTRLLCALYSFGYLCNSLRRIRAPWERDFLNIPLSPDLARPGRLSVVCYMVEIKPHNWTLSTLSASFIIRSGTLPRIGERGFPTDFSIYSWSWNNTSLKPAGPFTLLVWFPFNKCSLPFLSTVSYLQIHHPRKENDFSIPKCSFLARVENTVLIGIHQEEGLKVESKIILGFSTRVGGFGPLMLPFHGCSRVKLLTFSSLHIAFLI